MDATNKAVPDEFAGLRDAVGRLIKAKGRFHTEQNYAALIEAYDASLAAATSQPAAVSAPSDERAYNEAANLAKAIYSQHYRLSARDWRVLPDICGVISQISNMVAGMTRARAAAPVSGPTDDEPSEAEQLIACLGDDAATLSAQNPDDEMAQTMREAAAWITRASSKDNSAAPVSGQGASIGDDAEFRVLLTDVCAAYNSGLSVVKRERAFISHIMQWADSRPRSEDSRAKALEEAAQIGDALGKLYPEKVGYDVGYTMAANRCAAAIRALASTPPKADNE